MGRNRFYGRKVKWRAVGPYLSTAILKGLLYSLPSLPSTSALHQLICSSPAFLIPLPQDLKKVVIQLLSSNEVYWFLLSLSRFFRTVWADRIWWKGAPPPEFPLAAWYNAWYCVHFLQKLYWQWYKFFLEGWRTRYSKSWSSCYGRHQFCNWCSRLRSEFLLISCLGIELIIISLTRKLLNSSPNLSTGWLLFILLVLAFSLPDLLGFWSWSFFLLALLLIGRVLADIWLGSPSFLMIRDRLLSELLAKLLSKKYSFLVDESL